MRKVLIPFLLLGFVFHLSAQPVKDIMQEPIPVAMFQVTYAFELPAMNTRDMYGFNHSIGGSFVYKTESNWLFTANGNFITGNRVKGGWVSIFGEGITTVDGEIIGGSGSMSELTIEQRGFLFQAEVGKLFSYGTNPNSGFFVQGGLGYLRNRIRMDQSLVYRGPGGVIYAVNALKGKSVSQHRLSQRRLLNLSIALEVTYARTRELRDYDFRVFTNPETGIMEPVGPTDPKKRFNDFYYGIRVTWNIPTYQRQPEKYYYD